MTTLVIFSLLTLIFTIYIISEESDPKLNLKPIYRIDILRYARKQNKRPFDGMCSLLRCSLLHYGIDENPRVIFPNFTNKNARMFKANKALINEYWWKKCEWNTGRLRFLDWLIRQYENDKTDLRIYQVLT